MRGGFLGQVGVLCTLCSLCSVGQNAVTGPQVKARVSEKYGPQLARGSPSTRRKKSMSVWCSNAGHLCHKPVLRERLLSTRQPVTAPPVLIPLIFEIQLSVDGLLFVPFYG